MKITKLQLEDELNFNQLAQSYGTIFNTIEWAKIFNNQICPYGIYNDHAQLIGGFILFKEKKFGLTLYLNPPFSPEIGPFLKVDAQNPVSVMDTWKRTLYLMTDFIEKLPYAIVSFSLSRNIIDVQPFIWKEFKVIPEFTYLLDLTMSIEDIWMRMSNERRKNINKGRKDGLSVKKIEDFEVIKNLVVETFSRQKKRIDEFYLNRIFFRFANKNNSFAYATYRDTVPIAASFCIYDKNTAFYLLGGYDHKKKHHGAGALSMWEAIKYAKDLGLMYFDFEGSMVPQIERYFRGFGGLLTPYYRVNKATLPLEIILKFYKRAVF